MLSTNSCRADYDANESNLERWSRGYRRPIGRHVQNNTIYDDDILFDQSTVSILADGSRWRRRTRWGTNRWPSIQHIISILLAISFLQLFHNLDHDQNPLLCEIEIWHSCKILQKWLGRLLLFILVPNMHRLPNGATHNWLRYLCKHMLHRNGYSQPCACNCIVLHFFQC